MRTVDVSENLYIQYDPDDTWVAINDKNNDWYDELGVVYLQADEIDQLIEHLVSTKESMSNRKAILDFVAAVNRRALGNMAMTGRLEGAHYAAMGQVLKAMGMEMPPPDDDSEAETAFIAGLGAASVETEGPAGEVESPGDSLVNVAGGLAAKFLERRLKAGGDVEIPSLGLTIEGDEAGDE